MRFFKRRDDEPDMEMRRTRSHSLDRRPTTRSSFFVFNDHDDLTGPKINHTATVSKSNFNRKSNKSIGDLFKMLNCAAEKDEDFVEREEIYFVASGKNAAKIAGMTRSYPWGEALRKGKSQSDVIRPVLITVKDGDLEGRFSRNSRDNGVTMAELKSSFIIGGFPSSTAKPLSSPFKLGASVRRNPADKYSGEILSSAKNNKKKVPSRTSEVNRYSGSQERLKGSPRNHNESTALRTAREIARRERWQRGFEMQQHTLKTKLMPKADSNFDDEKDSIYAEDLTQDTQSTGGSTSFLTGDFSSIGGYSTYATETDEDSVDDSRFPRNRKRGRSTFRSPLRTDYRGSAPNRGTSRQQVFSSVMDDLGIVAGMFWVDGLTCLRTAAAITRETVASCKDEQ